MSTDTPKPKAARNAAQQLSAGAHALAALGPRCEQVVTELFSSESTAPLLLPAFSDANLKQLAQSLSPAWSDERAAEVVRAILNAAISGRSLDSTAASRWILSHPNDSAAVTDCISVEPPEEISIIRVLSRAGSQKLVFLATWRLTQRQVVLKRLGGAPDVRQKIVAREAQSHPLSILHPNIIETHFLKNSSGEVFLVEERLAEVLNDDWRSNGIQEAANLLYDIASAANYLHSELALVHGDIKPDNIGKRGPSYILLDFGICRSIQDFVAEPSATGSLRTRAPELLLGCGYPHAVEADVWAIGATIYNTLCGRFPLFDVGEKTPRISTPDERGKFEAILADRVRNEWDKRVDLAAVPDAIRGTLQACLDKDPSKRATSRILLERIDRDLSQFLRTHSDNGRFSPLEELQQLSRYLPDEPTLRLMPMHERQSLRSRLEKLRLIQNLEHEQQQHIESLLKKVS